ncbi:MAG TPA: tetratricopeptide repeat protein [Spirochaetota bacterium]|nr:tetratricopeptide repeat protein [Spirochaetota bacterium]
MTIREIDTIFNKGLDLMKRGNFKEAETLFEKAKQMTIESNKK